MAENYFSVITFLDNCTNLIDGRNCKGSRGAYNACFYSQYLPYTSVFKIWTLHSTICIHNLLRYLIRGKLIANKFGTVTTKTFVKKSNF